MPQSTTTDSQGNIIDKRTGRIVTKAGERNTKPLEDVTDEELDRRAREKAANPAPSPSPSPRPKTLAEIAEENKRKRKLKEQKEALR